MGFSQMKVGHDFGWGLPFHTGTKSNKVATEVSIGYTKFDRVNLDFHWFTLKQGFSAKKWQQIFKVHERP